jgi:hypothetical protein
MMSSFVVPLDLKFVFVNMNINVPALVVLLLGIIATVFFVAAAAETDWSHFSNDNTGAKTGPFRAETGGTTYRYTGCSAGGGIVWAGSDCSKWKTIQAFTLIGLISAGIATIVDGCAATVTWRFPGGISSFLFTLAGISGIIAMSIFAWFHNNRLNGSSYGPGFAFIIIAWVFSLFAAYFACFGFGTKLRAVRT